MFPTVDSSSEHDLASFSFWGAYNANSIPIISNYSLRHKSFNVTQFNMSLERVSRWISWVWKFQEIFEINFSIDMEIVTQMLLGYRVQNYLV